MMTSRPPIDGRYDGPASIQCGGGEREAVQTITKNGESIFVEGQHCPPSDDSEEIQRDFFLHRDHPEVWWGLACTTEFALTAGLMLLLVWSVVRDRRDFLRALTI